MIDAIFDNVFVVNLPTSEVRREWIKRHFAAVGITKYEFFPAIDGNDLDLEQMRRNGVLLFDTTKKRHLTPGEVGCYLSHFEVWLEALRRGCRSVLVCEDDVLFRDDLDRYLLEVWGDVPDDWEIVHFYTGEPPGSGQGIDAGRRRISEHVYAGCNEGAGAVAYGVGRFCLAYLCAIAMPIQAALDGVTNWPTGDWEGAGYLPGYVLAPPPAGTKELGCSEIGVRGDRT